MSAPKKRALDEATTTAKKKLKLSYFDLRDRGETSRYLLAIGGVEYEDHRYPFVFGTPGDWSTLKTDEFDAARKAGTLDANLGRVPILEVDGLEIPQSKAIERYLGKAFGLMGSTDEEAALVDALGEHCRDVYSLFMAAERGGKMDDFFATQLPDLLAKFEKAVVKANGNGKFLTGDDLSLADVQLYVLLTNIVGDKAKPAYAETPRLAAALSAVAVLPQVQQWEKDRPPQAF